MMIGSTILLLTLLSQGYGRRQTTEPCGQPTGCYCTKPVLHQIMCHNITVFPLFDDNIKPGVRTISFHKSRIVGLHPFEKKDWPVLNQLAFLQTTSMPCDAIANLSRPGLDILSSCILQPCQPVKECTTPEKEKCPVKKDRTICLATILVFVLLVGVWLGTICYAVYYYGRTGVYVLPKSQPIQTRQRGQGAEQIETRV